MDVVADINGGNAEMVESTAASEMTRKADELENQDIKMENIKSEEQEINGDSKGKKSLTPMAKRKLRRSKANSTNTNEAEEERVTKNQKRKHSEIDGITSEESVDFNGFDVGSMETSQTESEILLKLIAEAETPAKRVKRTITKGPRRNIEFKTVDDHSGLLDAREMKMKIDDSTDPLDLPKNTKDSDKSDGESDRKSPNNSMSSTVNRQKGVAATKQKPSSLLVTNPLFREPFKFGWKREIVYKGEAENPLKRSVEVYYYTPKGKKVRSLREIAEFLNIKELTIDNFTFIKESTGINDSEHELITEEPSDLNTSNTGSVSAKKVAIGTRRGAMTRKVAGKAASPPSGKWSPAKTTSPATLKALKVAGKKALLKPKEPISPPKDLEIISVTRRNQSAEKTPQAYKNKRSLKTKVQEPCSIRCPMSMGLIPSLQCCVCLCLYHPECVGHMEVSANEEYVCKNCRPTREEGKKSAVSITPPPLIPISMLGSQNIKSSELSSDKRSPPKLQKLAKSENPELVGKPSRLIRDALSITNKMDDPAMWFERENRDYFPRPDSTELKPAQNIARLGGKRYIVVPKNNDMAVQPAITVRPDKMPHRGLVLDDDSRNDTIFRQRPTLLPRVTRESTSKENTNTQDTVTQENNSLNSVNSTVPNENPVESSEKPENNFDVPLSLSIDVGKVTDDSTTETSDKIDIVQQSENSKTDNAQVSDVVQATDKSQDITMVDTTQLKKGAPPPPMEVDQRQYLMATVSAGYNALSRVFQYLKVQELLRASRVCKMWRDLAAHPALWKTVRMKNSQVTDWDGLVATLSRHGTQHLDLRKMLIAGESDNIWKKFVSVIPSVKTLVKLELCRCPVMVVEEVIKACPQLEVLSAMSIKCDFLNLDSIGNLIKCQELRLKAISGMLLKGDLVPLEKLTNLSHLSLTSVKELGKKKIEILGSLVNLETLELGECSDFPAKFGTSVLSKLTKLERLRLEKGQGTCCTFDILNGVSKLEKLHQLELVNFDVKSGFDKHLATCTNIRRLLIIPTYISQSATSNNMVLGGVTELSDSLTHFVWGVTLELLRVTELFVDQCNQMNKQVSGDSIPVLKPVPCLQLVENTEGEKTVPIKTEEKQTSLSNPQVDILPLPQLQKLLLAALPKTRVKILKIPFHATWRQNISDTSA